MPNYFHYLRGALGTPDLIATHKQAISRLLSGDYTPKNIEQLAGHHNVFSLRLGDAARLLFTIITVQGQKSLLALEYLPNHEYHKSKFLRSKLCLDYYTHSVEASALEFDDHAGECLFKELQLEGDTIIDAVELDFYQQTWLRLNELQQEVLQVRLPAIISGAAGSGKSCVALSLLHDYQLQHPGQPMLYITRSKPLVVQRHQDWGFLPISNEANVVFKTFVAFIQDSLPCDWQNVGRDYFNEWYKLYVRIQTNIQKTLDKSCPYQALDSDTFYEELRIASGYTLADYLGLGQSQTLVEVVRRQELYKALESYRTRLIQQKLYDESFYQFPSDLPPFSLIVVDEAQDLSYGQALQLFRLADAGKIVFCLDGHQRLLDRRSILPYLRHHFKIHEDNRVVVLPNTYRCAPVVTSIANEVLRFKHEVLEGKVDKRDYTDLEPRLDEMLSTGFVHMFDPKNTKALPGLEMIAEQSNIIFITYPEHKEEIKKIFKVMDAVIFTPLEIKGLESDVVFTWKLCRADILRLIRLDTGHEKFIVHQGKHVSKYEKFTQYFNEIFTAVTRAKCRLVFFEERGRETDVLLGRFHPHLTLPEEHWAMKVSTPEEWLNQVKKLWDLDLKDRAKMMYLQKVGNEEMFASQLLAWAPEVILDSTVVSLPSVEPMLSTKHDDILAARKLSAAVNPVPAAASISALENKHILALHENFSEMIITSAINECDLVRLFRYEAIEIDQKRFSLLYFMQKDMKRMNLFFILIVNNLKFLCHNDLLDVLDPRGLSFKFSKTFNLKRLQVIELHQLYKKLHNIKRLLSSDVPPLLAAIQESMFKAQRLLCDLGANLNLVDQNGNAMLHLYTALGNVAIVSLLISKGVDISVTNSQEMTAAHFAARQGNKEILEKLFIAGIDINKRDINGLTPFLHAAINGQVDVVVWLAKHGANIHEITNDGRSALIFAVSHGNIPLLQKLLQLKVDVKHVANDGWGPMHIAIQHKFIDVIRILYAAKTPLTQKTRQGYTPIFLAAAFGIMPIVEFFLEKNVTYEAITLTQTQLLDSVFNKCGNSLVRILGWIESYKLEEPSIELFNIFPHDIAAMMGFGELSAFIKEYFAAKNFKVSRLGLFAKDANEETQEQELKRKL